MPNSFRASRDVIIRTEKFEDAVRFYESVLGLAIVHRTDTLVGFDARCLPLVCRARSESRRRVRFSGSRDARGPACAARCRVRYCRGRSERSALLHSRPLRARIQHRASRRRKIACGRASFGRAWRSSNTRVAAHYDAVGSARHCSSHSFDIRSLGAWAVNGRCARQTQCRILPGASLCPLIRTRHFS